MSKFRVGLVVGKFWPFHLGHEYVINTAREQCDVVLVLVIYQNHQEPSGLHRLWAIWDTYGDGFTERTRTNVFAQMLEDLPHYPDDRDWALAFEQQLRSYVTEEKIDAVFGSEEWGPVLADVLDATYVTVDLKREQFPISATEIRADPLKHIDWVHPNMRWFYEGE